MKENRKLLKEVLKDIRHDMSDEEVLNLLADSKISDRASQRAKASITARRLQYTSNRIPAFPILRADKGDFQ